MNKCEPYLPHSLRSIYRCLVHRVLAELYEFYCWISPLKAIRLFLNAYEETHRLNVITISNIQYLYHSAGIN